MYKNKLSRDLVKVYVHLQQTKMSVKEEREMTTGNKYQNTKWGFTNKTNNHLYSKNAYHVKKLVKIQPHFLFHVLSKDVS